MHTIPASRACRHASANLVSLAALVLLLCAQPAQAYAKQQASRRHAGAARADRAAPNDIRTEPRVDASVPGDWLTEVSEKIRRQEYDYSALDTELWSAPNRSQELRSRVDRNGLEVFPRETDASGEDAVWKLRIGTASFGRVGNKWPTPSRAISIDGERVELDRGGLIEWFVNDERGIEQGWTIENRPPGIEPLAIGLAIEGDLSLRLDDGGRSGVFVDGAGEPRVRYTGLIAWDASGRELRAWMLPGSTGVDVHVEDSGAVYPVTVDPVMTSAAWIAEANEFSEFGFSVSAAGDVNGDGYPDVIVGAHYHNNPQLQGRVYVYHGSAAGLNATEAWTAESDQGASNFGYSVSTAGDVNGDGYSDIIVGARDYKNGLEGEGRVFVYHGSATGLAATAAWTAESAEDAFFGASVSTAGDVNGDGYSDVIVGAVLHSNNNNVRVGGAFVYHGSANGLSANVAWTAESNQAYSGFGVSVSTAGDINGDGYSDVIVGAHSYSNGELDEGRAFVYHGSATGLDATEAWTAESNRASSGFGFSVSTAGDINGDGYSDVLVGAPSYDNGEAYEGRAYVYHGSATGLSASEAWTAESNQPIASFGYSVSTAGDVNGDGFSDVIVGARTYDNGEVGEGRAYVYHGSITGLGPTERWSAESNQSYAEFGRSVSAAGDVNGDGYADVVVGAPGYDSSAGRAYVYRGSAAGLSPTEKWIAQTNQAEARFGFSVSEAGDVNGDGYSDVIVGAPNYDVDVRGEGRAFLFYGSAAGLELAAAWTASGDAPDATFGYSVSTAGDVDGDGYSDVVVGAPHYSGGERWEGRVYVFRGSPTGLRTADAWTTESNQQSVRLGWSVSTAGDVNGDGYSDVIIGTFSFISTFHAFLYEGSPTGLGANQAWTAPPTKFSDHYGWSVSTAGDVNGDGYSDVIIGAPFYDNGGPQDHGRAYVYHGSVAGLGATEAWTAESDQAFARLGFSVSSAGDVNGDGYSDVIVGAPEYDNGESNEGRAYVYHGSPTGLDTIEAWIAESDQPDAEFGFSVSTVRDVNGDGYSDIVVGAPFFDSGEPDEGRAFAYRGSATGLSVAPAWTAESNQVGAQFGISVSSAGDVNGDGYSDLIVGAADYVNSGGNFDSAFVYLGNHGDGGLVRASQQRRANGSAPIDLLGLTVNDRGGFMLRASFPHALAGVRWADPRTPTVYLEWEVKPLGEPFTGIGLERSAVGQTVGTLPTTLTFDELTIRALRSGPHKWRARFVFENSPLYPKTPWFSLPGNAITETKLRFPTNERPPRSSSPSKRGVRAPTRSR